MYIRYGNIYIYNIYKAMLHIKGGTRHCWLWPVVVWPNSSVAWMGGVACVWRAGCDVAPVPSADAAFATPPGAPLRSSARRYHRRRRGCLRRRRLLTQLATPGSHHRYFYYDFYYCYYYYCPILPLKNSSSLPCG
jgi:hypothetical protein